MGMNRRKAEQMAGHIVRWGLTKLKETRGGLTSFTTKAGKQQSFANERLKRGDMMLSPLLLLAAELGMTLPELFDRAMGEADFHEYEVEKPDASFGPSYKLPEIARTAVSLFTTEGPGNCEICDQLREIDNKRYDDPLNYLLHVKEILPQLPSNQIAYALGVAASCYRLLMEYTNGMACLEAALWMAKKSNNEIARGDVHQRLTYLVNNMGDKPAALRFAEAATIIFTSAGSKFRTGASIIDRAWCFLTMKDYQKSLTLFQSAHTYNDTLDNKNIVACLHGISASLARLGRVSEAREYGYKSTEMAEQANLFLVGKSYCLAGVIELEAENFDNAIDCLFAAMNYLKEKYPIDAAVASADLIIAFLSKKDFMSARRLALEMIKFSEPFKGIEEIENLILDIVSLAKLPDGLDVENVRSAKAKIDAGRARFWRARRRTGSNRLAPDLSQNWAECFR